MKAMGEGLCGVEAAAIVACALAAMAIAFVCPSVRRSSCFHLQQQCILELCYAYY